MKLEIFKSSFGYYNLRTVDGYPTDEMTEYLKSNGYRWSRNNNCWYPATAEAKEANLHDDFVVKFQEKFFPPVSESQEPKSFGQELFEREQRKTEWRESHGLSTKDEHSVEKVSDDERITYLENLIKELQEERQKDKEKIAHLEFELANNRDEGMTEFYSQQEQQQIDEEAEWEKENTLTDEEEQAIINDVIPETSIVNNADVMNKLGEIMEAVAREEEPEAEKEFSESQEKEEVEVEVSPEELSLAKSVLPTSQYVTTLRLSQGEEGNFFKQKIKDIAEVVKNAPKIYETNGAEQHPIVLRYFHPTGTETLVTEIGEDGEAFGYQCLNGDYEMAEFGYLDLNEIKNTRMMEIDYHVEKGMTVERWLYKEQPEMFPQYAKFAEQSEEKNPLNIAKETGNDVNAISDSLDKSKKRYYYNPYSQEYFTIAFEDNDWHSVFYDKDYNVLSDDVGITPDSPNNITEAIDTILEMRYNIDGFDPDGMSTSEYESARAEKEHYLSKNWTIWTDEQGFENILEEKRKVEEENEKKISVLKDILKNDEELKQSALVNNRQDFENAYYDKLSEILIKQYDNDKSDFTRNLLNSDVSKKEIMGEYIDEIYNGFISDKNEKVINAENNAYPYNFFINDVANLDLGIGAEIEPITGLTAEQAVLKYAELKEKGYAIYIGLNIPGDFVFDDKEGQGAEIFGQVNGRPSFYMGDNFVKELKEYDSHARTVIAAYKELYEMADKYILGVERPDFVYDKDNELWAKYLDEDTNEQFGIIYDESLSETETETEYKNETEAEYKIMQEISKGLTPDEIKLNLEKYRESLVYAQEKSNETWDDFYSRNTTGFDTPQTIEEFRKAYEGNKKQFEYDVKKYTGWIKALEEKQSINVSDEEIAQEKVLIQNKINQLKEELNNPENQKGGMNYDENAEKELLEHIQRFENISDEEIKKQIIWKKENQKNNEATAKNVDNYITELAQNRVVPQDGELLSFNETHPLITVTNKQTGRQTSIRPFGDLAETVKNMARLKTISEANNVIENIKISGFEIASTTSRIIVYDNDKFFDFDYFAGAVGKLDNRNLNDWDFKTFVDNDLKITKKMNESLQIENPINAKLKENINWSEYTEEAFTKTKADLHNWIDGEVYASINVGQLSFELVPQNYGDRMELDTRIYYPKLYATYGEDADGVKYDTASGFDIDAETFAKMSYEEFKDYFANTVLPSSLDKDLIERALQPTEDWNSIWEKLNKENNFSYMFPEGFFKNSKELDKYEVEYEGTFDFGETDGICQVVSGDKKTLEKIAADYGYELHPDYLYHKDDLDLDDRTAVHDMAFRSVDFADSFKSENVEVIKEPETQQLTSKKDIKAIREQCREILEKLDNSYLKDNEMSYLENELGEKREEDRKQVEASLRSMKYIYSTTKDSEGYWNTSGKEITANEARKMLSMSDFVSAVDRASFHYTSGRVVKDNNDKEIGYIHFDDSDRNKIVPPYELTKEDLSILAQYEGAGGLNEINRTNAGILNEFYTPNYLVEKVWQIVDAYAPDAKTVLEPSAGVGKFANNRPNNEFTMHELDETSARINKILHPEANIVQGAYQKQFFDEGERFINKNFVQPKYDVVIGNPPYGKYNDKYKGLGEGKEFDRYEEYFIAKGLDALKDENSLLALVVPSGFLNTAWDKSKSLIAEKGEIIDAYRLPEGTFPTTEVGTDIIIMRSWSNYEHAFEKEYGKDLFMSIENHKRDNSKMLAWGEWFKAHPEKILGEVKTRTNRFGKEEEYVTVHEGFTVQDELNKIDEFVKQSTPNFDKNIDKVLVDEKTNYVLEKLSKAGIEVVTDKEEFDRILESQTILQKMTENFSLEKYKEKYSKISNENPLAEEITFELSENLHNLRVALDDYFDNGKRPTNDRFFIGKTPLVLQKTGSDLTDVTVPVSVIKKAVDIHGLSKEEIFNSLAHIYNPVLVFNSDPNTTENKVDSKLVLTDVFKVEKPIALAVNINSMIDINNRGLTIEFQDIRSVHDRNVISKNGTDLILKWTMDGLCRYVDDKKITDWSTVARVQFPIELLQSDNINILTKSSLVNIQTYKQNGKTYGFAYEGKIYLNPALAESETAIHEYTHLWDSYTQKTNPELWQKGLNIFKDTSLWEDVINDENYADIKNDENLILSECHARICGKIADEVLQKVLERDGNLKQAEMIDWDKEVDQYIYENFESSRTLSDGQAIKSTGYGAFGTVVDVNAIRSWFSAPMKDLFQRELNLKLEQQQDSNRHVSVENETPESNNKLLRTPKSYPYINNDGSLNPDRLIKGDIIIDKEDNTPYESNMIFGNDFLRVTSISMKKESSSLFEEFDEKSRNDEQSYELGMGWKNVLNERFSAPTKEQLETWKYPSWYQHHLDEQEEYESERDYIRQPVLKVLEESKNGKSFEKEELIHVYAETLAKELDFICHHNDVSFEERINPATNEKTTFLTDEYGYARIDHEIPEICDFYGADLVKAVIYNSVIHFSEENENDTYLRLQKEYPEFFNEDTKNLSILDFVKNVSCTKEFAGQKVHGNSVWDLTREYINNLRDNSIDENHRLVNVIEKNGIQINVSSKSTVLKESAQDQHSLNPADKSEQITEEVVKTKTTRPKKDKWNIQKSKGEVMTAQEFSRLYGRDFDEREFPIWAATDWQGNIDISKLNVDDLQYMENSGNYICKKLDSGKPEWTHKVLFTTGDIYAKIEEQKKLLSEADGNSVLIDMYQKNIELLESSKKNKLNMEHIHFGLKSTLAEEFTISQYDGEGNFVNLNLQESFILWAQGHTLASRRYRSEIDFATSNISREELGEELSFNDIIDYIDGKPVKADAVRGWRTYRMSEEEKKAEKAERKKEADLKRQARADIANKLFDRYLHEGLELETIPKLEEEYNRRFNSYVIPDYSKLPLFVDGMSAYKGDSKFKLYKQQLKGISFLCNKGNGLLAYDVGLGKTAAGIVATVNQIQTGRSNRPLIIVPNQVYAKWYTDIKQLFPNVKVNDLYNFNKESVGKYIDPENPHKLTIPENSISLCTYEALKNITFTDESCENELYQDFSNLLSADMDGSDRENAESSDKIKGIIGSASHVKDESYYFFEECGFDNLTVDEAHNFKNLWVVPRPKKKGQSNEYAGIPSGKPSARALKMYGMTQLVQEHNDNRNVFMLTATPFTNSPTEVYSMLSYIGRERLHRAGIKSLRSFFDQFAQTKQELGVTSKGEIDTKQVMKNWKELPALQSILTEFIDKVDGKEALITRPHKFTHVKPLDMSELQLQMREMDEERMAEVKEGNSAAVIVAMNNMRLSCVAPALANPEMYEGLELPPLSKLVETSPKLKFVCDAIIDMYKENPEKGQFMYVPLGKDSHGIIKDYLVQHGIPKEAVEIINGEINNTPEKKEKITGKFNNAKDKLKIIIGGRNTSEGIDLNGNSFVMYNCSLGWNPSETIQAEGRIWRQNNLQGHVHIVYPVMNDSIDSVLYQKHDEKISRIDELWSYKGDSLNVEDINPEDLKLDLIKDPNKKAKLILEEETKDVKAELSKLNLKIKDFDEIIEKRKQLTLDFGTTEENVKRYEKQIQDYKDRNLEVPEWLKLTLKNYKKDLEKEEYQKNNIQKKLYSWNLETEEDEAAYIHELNEQKRACEEKIHHIEETLPEILQKLQIERMEQKIMEYPVAKQRESLEADILNNLRPMKEVEFEIRTERHNKMLAEMLKAGDITQEEHDLYKSAGYEKYEKWLDGEIESLEENLEENIAHGEKQQSREVEENNKVTDEYGFEVFGENAPTKQEEINKEVETSSETKNNSEKIEKLKTATENAKKIVGANTISKDPSDLFFGFTDDDLFVKSPDKDIDRLVVKSPEQLYFNFDSDDSYLTPEQLSKAEQERDKIVLPILNGKESGMYKAFKDFSRDGIFDIVGTKIDMKETANGNRISPSGWKQLHAAMNIYRNKQFETFRYVLVDRHNGRIKDQLSVCSYMPNVCKVSAPDGKTLKDVLSRAEETDSLIVAVHNHPSGNVQESIYDRDTTKSLEKSCMRSDGLQRFAGHIILDHDNFNIYKPRQGWKVYEDKNSIGIEDELINKDFAYTDTKIHTTSQLLNVAKNINETNNWNDNFIPVLFVNSDSNVSGLKYYDKSFFNKENQSIRNELQFSAIDAGAVYLFPVVTEALTNKLNGSDRFLMEERMKELVMQGILTDVVLTDSTVVEKNNLPDRRSLYEDFIKLAKTDIKSTWEHKINPTLFEQLKMGTLKIIQNEEPEKETQKDLSHLKKAAGMGY